MMQQTAYAVVLFLLLGTLYTEALMTQEEIRTLAKKCGANEEDINVAVKYQVPDTPSGKCLMLCTLKELKTLTTDGNFIENVAFTSLSTYWPEIQRHNLEKIAKFCAKEMAPFASEKNTCEYGYKSITCINKRFAEVRDTYLPQELSYSPYIDFDALRKFSKELKNNGSTANFRGRSVINMKDFEEKLLPLPPA